MNNVGPQMVFNTQVVIIGDGAEVSYEIMPALERTGFRVRNFISAEHYFNSSFRPINIIYIVDSNLSGISGNDVIRTIRHNDKLSIIILLLSCNDPDCIVSGFKYGADCYVIKPLNMEEIVERAKSAHVKLNFMRKNIKTHELSLLPETFSVVNNGLTVDLTSREFVLFRCLFKHMGTVCTREQLVQEFKSEKGMAIRNIDVHIFTLRKKLLPIGVAVDTVWKIGYRVKIADT